MEGELYGLVNAKYLKARSYSTDGDDDAIEGRDAPPAKPITNMVSFDDDEIAENDPNAGAGGGNNTVATSGSSTSGGHHEQLSPRKKIQSKTRKEMIQYLKEVDSLLMGKTFGIYRQNRYGESDEGDAVDEATVVMPEIKEFMEAILRNESFQISTAADRLESHWKTKMELFGTASTISADGKTTTQTGEKLSVTDLLKKNVTLQDCNLPPAYVKGVNAGDDEEEEVIAFQKVLGRIQLLPTRDLAGRAIVFFKFDSTLFYKYESTFRKYIFYILRTALEDDETQTKGITVVVWNTDNYAATASSWLLLGSLLDSFWSVWKRDFKTPFRIDRLHYCIMSHQEQYTVKEYQESPTQIRSHTGSHQECLHALMTYGIPSHMLPVDQDGNIVNEQHLAWLNLKHRMEESTEKQKQRLQSFGGSQQPPEQQGLDSLASYSTDHDDVDTTNFTFNHNHHPYTSDDTTTTMKTKIVMVPSSDDVLFGKRIHHLSTPGNIRYHQLLLSNLEEYYQLTKSNQSMTARRTRSPEDEERLHSLYQQIWYAFVGKPDDNHDTAEGEGSGGGGSKFLQSIENGLMWEQMDEATVMTKFDQALEYLCNQLYRTRSNIDGTDSRDSDEASMSSGKSDIRSSKRKLVSFSGNVLAFGDFMELSSKQCWSLLHCEGMNSNNNNNGNNPGGGWGDADNGCWTG